MRNSLSPKGRTTVIVTVGVIYGAFVVLCGLGVEQLTQAHRGNPVVIGGTGLITPSTPTPRTPRHPLSTTAGLLERDCIATSTTSFPKIFLVSFGATVFALYAPISPLGVSLYPFGAMMDSVASEGPCVEDGFLDISPEYKKGFETDRLDCGVDQWLVSGPITRVGGFDSPPRHDTQPEGGKS